MGKEVQHLVRAVILLVAIVAGIVLVRQAMIPKTFGEFGYYRGENVVEWTSRSPVFSHVSLCNNCHASNYSKWSLSKHAGVSCEICHGPGTSHIEAGKPLTTDKSSSLCLACHEKLTARPAGFPQVDSGSHGGGLSCATCHNPHDPVIGKVVGIPHTLNGKADCEACHGALGFVPKPASHLGRASNTCQLCHQPSSVPFVPHALTGRGECLACHQNGTNGAIVVPRSHAGRTSETCLQCHNRRGAQ